MTDLETVAPVFSDYSAQDTSLAVEETREWIEVSRLLCAALAVHALIQLYGALCRLLLEGPFLSPSANL